MTGFAFSRLANGITADAASMIITNGTITIRLATLVAPPFRLFLNLKFDRRVFRNSDEVAIESSPITVHSAAPCDLVFLLSVFLINKTLNEEKSKARDNSPNSSDCQPSPTDCVIH